MASPDLLKLVAFVARNLADHPEKVSVESSEDGGTLQVRLIVAEEDKGKIIGRQGKVIKAIRSVAAAAAGQGRRVLIDLE
jgi:predicted RNA-binding protein YlqC (UPF0109 family)